MSLANILVHLDSNPRTAVRLALAVRLAERTGARLTGLFAETADAHHVGVVAVWPSDKYTAAMEAAQAAFVAGSASVAERATFIDTNRGSEAEILTRVTAIARSFDLVILGQTLEGVAVPAKLPEHVIIESGRPILVVPFVGNYPDIGHRPLFAWSHSRGSARALADARLVLTSGCEALVIEIERAGEARDEFSDLVVANLAAHKVVARFEQIIVEEVDVMDTLLNAAADHSADVLAIGAFDSGSLGLLGHGAGTRFILGHMTLPVLFSH
ncbi:MAG: universal stress protein [Roseiarcus sp.]|jgi:nucleotide-binding universal stress UspA family protein